MLTWDDSESEEEDFDEEHANVALMAKTSTSEVISECELTTDDESDSDNETKVFYFHSRNELDSCLSEVMEKYKLLSEHKTLKNTFVVTSENFTKSEQNGSDLNEKIFAL